MTDVEKLIIELLDDELYTVQFVEEWTGRPAENVFINAPAALQQIAVDGFYRAVRRMAENLLIAFCKVEGLECRTAYIMVNDPAGVEVKNDDKFERFVANFNDMTEDDFVEFMISCCGYCAEMLCTEVKDFRRETQCTHCFYRWAKKEASYDDK